MRATRSMTAWVVAAAGLWLLACGGGSETTGGGGSTSSAGGAGSSTGGATGQGGGSSGVGGFHATGGGNAQGGGEGCLTSEAAAEESPLDLIVLLDRSASMAGPVWNGSVAALTTFFQSPGGASVSAGLEFFPPSGSEPQCQPSSYNPIAVPVADLATSSATLVSAVQSQSPAGAETPTWAALYGTLQFATNYQEQNADHVVVVVLASDGDPTACNTQVTDIADIASTALAYNGVRTFVVAIQGATLANLDQIAAAGGTGQAFDVTSDISLFSQKLDEIRAQVVACEFLIPEPGDGMDFDPTKLNVTYDPGGMGSPGDIPQVANLDACNGGDGWYYDNPNAPTKALLCPATCDTVQADGMAKVSFVFGCPTIVK
ncbi:MAG: VWA domain-containing protein [Polyangiaceae bacterium]